MLVLFLCSLFLLLFIGVPVALAMLLSASFMLFKMDMFDTQLIAENFVMGTNNFPLMAIPFFMLTGEIMKHGGISERIINFAMSIVGHIKGGLGYVVIISGLIFAGLSGSAVADTAALGAILIPMMAARKYDISRSTGLICATGIISVVIPPSIPMIIYGITAGTSITKLFMGGAVPGLLMVIGLWAVWKFLYRNETSSVKEKQSTQQRWLAFKKAFLPLLLPVIIIVGLRGGIFTPTEAGVVAAIYAAIISILYKELNVNKIQEIFLNTIKTTSMVMFVAAAAMISAFAITVAQIPMELVEFLKGVTNNPTILMLILMLFLLLVGCVMDLIPAVLIFVPVILPLLRAYHIDPTYFGIMMVINLSIGLITPPIGTVLYVGSGISKLGIGSISKGILPFLLVYIAILLLMVFFPNIVIVPMNWLS
ncbi:TRAP transporter large permease [Avibacterium paragallinarum]|uniref:TRAP transporter large permease protein n=1 Tax=Avibacterium paragallinarum TaxID=728 RepID=A0A377IAD5_AVIPA|nr:TRAP transporter large permease [Avibacterium paragallinarum]POY47363.1 TRAP transporter large permease [Avibacterium paragallinarum]RZN77054.1 TRAP transporter large permease [Avibacterium paragallinarum]CDF99038.1 Putative TRAP-T family tripartite ATP-independent periplasmic transporter, membrane protein [Avibacterium paragallinarum JF4211]STO71722.1 TRAP-type C4-dicarboxylate transport system, large permease [Avibacterium paragallinarum]